ncbi:heterokaryon incompatibility protein-domain-containing protein [Lasiosphaeria miniovina]|uniref:Heterokaryon incompatibility protein-domain-containing protein n=1 Tax=Lasiosphaeria miniovina TaxID=1954250 RepID=A0AA40DVN1_9PEZI|nr:heterokaryon incompatibility protein-domain-containing protein [Lasiosphaeria miniovina]KAK0713433.1 heterokaryon incompatibility protein-domain-containing protein [Lasiosphaeria miniovina]
MSTLAARLCDRCQGFDVCKPFFNIIDTLPDLKSSQSSCDFCKMRWEVCHSPNGEPVQSIRFDREQSTLKLNESLLPVISICRSPDLVSPHANAIQIGLPRIAEAASWQHLSTLRRWLSDCDKNHPKCRPVERSRPAPRPPTRLIDVGTIAKPLARLLDTQASSPASVPYKYAALSHPWGPEPHFCTFSSTLDQHKQRIPVERSDFPATFRDAIATTRELGLRHLWIDSICIVQGPDGDFGVESKRMEDVFSSAYCVIAASRARGQTDGFQGPRKQRQFLELPVKNAGAAAGGQGGTGRLFVCQFIDDFGEHVLNSPLSRRGWVLQERALARRSIYFTDWQAYWECGEGVRCETLSMVNDKLASFLGNPHFPSKLSSNLTDRGEKIRFYEDIYKRYSRLDLSRITDRAVAIAGLERRMLTDLNARGGFGIFDDGRSLLPRTLLWRRGEGDAAAANRRARPPSWSWAAYDGVIDFLTLPLGEVDWREDQIYSPWKTVGGREERKRRRRTGCVLSPTRS